MVDTTVGTNAEDAPERDISDLSPETQASVLAGIEDAKAGRFVEAPPDLDEKPTSTAKAFSGGLPEQHLTPITERLLSAKGFRKEKTNLWSLKRSDKKVSLQFNDVSKLWYLVGTNTVVNSFEEVEA